MGATTVAEAGRNHPLPESPGRGLWLWLFAGLVAGLIVVLYFRILPEMAKDWWDDPGASHGILIPPVALYIAWLRRDLTLAEPVFPDLRGLWLTLCACLMLLVGILGAEYFLSRASFVLLLAGLIWTFWGVRRFRTLLFPLVLLLTMIPLPQVTYNTLAAPLQLMASSVATRLVQALGIAVYQDGNVIHLAGISLGVAEACSGLRSLSSLVTAALMVGFLQCTRIRTRVLLVALSIPVAIGMNVVRVTGTALIAEYNQQYALGYYHSFSGWLVFLVGFGVVALAAKLLHAWME
ncbi:MAG TPA: exosortase/archaeosortase family protein [Bryobacteraceae bacterium]|nr:exosortase/archaeosortase family protein [Bryobacteraceae bacterium]